MGLFFEPQKFRIVVSGAAAHYNGYLWEDVLGKDFIDIWRTEDRHSELALQ